MALWSAVETKYLIDNVGHKFYKDIAAYLNRSFTSVSKKAERIGVNTEHKKWVKKRREHMKEGEVWYTGCWTEQDIQYLSDHIGLMSYQEIGKKLNRTTTSVKWKAKRCRFKLSDNYYSSVLLSQELGVSDTTIMRWYYKGYIKGKFATWKNGYLRPCCMFVEEDIVIFLKTYPHLLQGKVIEHLYFKNVVKEALMSLPEQPRQLKASHLSFQCASQGT